MLGLRETILVVSLQVLLVEPSGYSINRSFNMLNVDVFNKHTCDVSLNSNNSLPARQPVLL